MRLPLLYTSAQCYLAGRQLPAVGRLRTPHKDREKKKKNMRSFVKRLGLAAVGALFSAAFILSPLPAAAMAEPLSRVPQEGEVVQGTLATNPTIQFQGRLLDPTTGQPKSDGVYTMTFRLYSDAAGGTALWTETKNLTLTRGLFNTQLGDTTPLPPEIFTGQPLYLAIQVGNDAEAAPRQVVDHNAYAFYAENAGRLEGLAAKAFAKAAHLHTGDDIVDGSITAADLDTAYAHAAHTHTGDDIVDGTISAADLNSALPRAKFINLDVYGAYLTTGGTFSNGYGPNGGIHLADAANGSFYLNLTLPPDYTTGGAITVHMVWHTSATNCSVEFVPNAMSAARPGRTHITGPTTGSGITVVDGTRLFAPATANQSNSLLVTLSAPDGTTPLQAGDAISFSLFRSGSGTNDNCAADFVLQGALVTYE